MYINKNFNAGVYAVIERVREKRYMLVSRRRMIKDYVERNFIFSQISWKMISLSHDAMFSWLIEKSFVILFYILNFKLFLSLVFRLGLSG